MDFTSLMLVAGGGLLLASNFLPSGIKLPTIPGLAPRDTLLADLGVVRRLGERLRDEGNLSGAKAADALIVAALAVQMPTEKARASK